MPTKRHFSLLPHSIRKMFFVETVVAHSRVPIPIMRGNFGVALLAVEILFIVGRFVKRLHFFLHFGRIHGFKKSAFGPKRIGIFRNNRTFCSLCFRHSHLRFNKPVKNRFVSIQSMKCFLCGKTVTIYNAKGVPTCSVHSKKKAAERTCLAL